jgi:hypothetical protein
LWGRMWTRTWTMTWRRSRPCGSCTLFQRDLNNIGCVDVNLDEYRSRAADMEQDDGGDETPLRVPHLYIPGDGIVDDPRPVDGLNRPVGRRVDRRLRQATYSRPDLGLYHSPWPCRRTARRTAPCPAQCRGVVEKPEPVGSATRGSGSRWWGASRPYSSLLKGINTVSVISSSINVPGCIYLPYGSLTCSPVTAL